MAFKVYPDPAREPLSIPPGGTSDAVRIVARFGPGGATPPTMQIHGIVLGELPNDAVPEVTVVLEDLEVPVTSRDGVDPTAVGESVFASLYTFGRAGRGAFRVAVWSATAPAGAAWAVRFRNPTATDMRLTWVVADTLRDARQPWLEVPDGFAVDARPGQAVPFRLRLRNFGTGPLTLDEPVGTAPMTRLSDDGRDIVRVDDVQLVDAPSVVAPNGSADLTLRFAGRDEPGSFLASYLVTSGNDPRARPEVPDLGPWTRVPHGSRATVMLASHPAMTPTAPGHVFYIDRTNSESLPPTPWTGNFVGRIDPATGDDVQVAVDGSALYVRSLVAEPGGSVVLAAWDPFRDRPVLRRMGPDGALTTFEEGEDGDTGTVSRRADGTVVVARSVSLAEGSRGEIHDVDPRTGASARREGLDDVGWLSDSAVSPDGTVLAVENGADSQGIIEIVPHDPWVALRNGWASSLRSEKVAADPRGRILVLGAVDGGVSGTTMLRVDPQSGAEDVLIGAQESAWIFDLTATADGAVLYLITVGPQQDRETVLVRLTPDDGVQEALSRGGSKSLDVRGLTVVP